MTTTYLSNYAVTSFDTLADLLNFIRGSEGLQILDVDHLRRYIAWKF